MYITKEIHVLVEGDSLLSPAYESLWNIRKAVNFKPTMEYKLPKVLQLNINYLVFTSAMLHQ